jgi:adenine-specific DNA-methyltransferase
MPHKFMNANYGTKIREFITDNSFLQRIIHFGAQQVFTDASTYTGLFFMNKGKNDVIEFFSCSDFEDLSKPEGLIFQESSANSLTKDEWVLLDKKAGDLLKRLMDQNSTLEKLTHRIFQGLKTSADKIYIVEKLSETPASYSVFCREDERTYELEKKLLFPLVKGGDSSPYRLSNTDLLILFPYQKGKLISSEILKKKTPKIWSYLNLHKKFLESGNLAESIGMPSAGTKPWM